MKVSCEVLEELTESFMGKRGPRTMLLWVCLDRTPNGGALRNTFDYEVSAYEEEKLAGKVLGGFVELMVTEIRAGFGGRVRCKGRVSKFGGEEFTADGKR